MQGAWVEIFLGLSRNQTLKSLPVRGTWVEMQGSRSRRSCPWASLPVRGAWVEIMCLAWMICATFVAPRAGSVD